MFGVIYGMLFSGKDIKHIKSACQVKYANYLHDKQDINKAILYYNKAINLDVNNYYAYGSLAATYFEKKEFEQALKYCKKADAIMQGISVHIMMVVIYDVLGDTKLSEGYLQRVMKFYNNDVVAAYDRLSYTYYQIEMYRQAEYYCKEALKIKPFAASLHYNLGNIYIAQQKLPEAKEQFNKVLELANNKRYKKYSIKSIDRLEKIIVDKKIGTL